jgi:kynureninase
VSAAVSNAEFLIPDGGPYLATHSVGCLTTAAAEALQRDYLEPWRRHGAEAWDGWLGGIDRFRGSLAQLLGGSAGDYCPQSNLSAALAALLGALPRPDPRRNVWLAAEDSFPSMGFVLRRAESLGYRTLLIPRARDPGSLQSWLDALTADVQGVLVTHVFSNTGVVSPLAAIARHARAAGVLCVADVAQSAGILPVSVEELGADVIIGSCVKWLCGGPGAGFLWMRESLANRLEPSDVGWFSHAEPFEMDIHAFRFAPGVRRFWGGTPSVAPYVCAAASLGVLAGIGVAAVHAHTRSLQAAFHDALPAHWRERVPLAGIGGTLCIRCGDARQSVRDALRKRGAQFDVRGEVVRLSFHVCNSAEQACSVAGAFE